VTNGEGKSVSTTSDEDPTTLNFPIDAENRYTLNLLTNEQENYELIINLKEE